MSKGKGVREGLKRGMGEWPTRREREWKMGEGEEREERRIEEWRKTNGKGGRGRERSGIERGEHEKKRIQGNESCIGRGVNKK